MSFFTYLLLACRCFPAGSTQSAKQSLSSSPGALHDRSMRHVTLVLSSLWCDAKSSRSQSREPVFAGRWKQAKAKSDITINLVREAFICHSEPCRIYWYERKWIRISQRCWSAPDGIRSVRICKTNVKSGCLCGPLVWGFTSYQQVSIPVS